MNFSQYTDFLQQILTYTCMYFYSFFISSFLFIYLYNFSVNFKLDNTNFIREFYKKYIVFSTIFDSVFLLGIFGATFIITLLFEIENVFLQLFLLIVITCISVYLLFYIILPMVNYNSFCNSLVKQFKDNNVFCHYLVFSILIFAILRSFKFIL